MHQTAMPPPDPEAKRKDHAKAGAARLSDSVGQSLTSGFAGTHSLVDAPGPGKVPARRLDIRVIRACLDDPSGGAGGTT